MNFDFIAALPQALIWAQSSTPDSVPWLAWILWLLVGFFGIFPGVVAYMVWAERKVAARFQDRIGPNRVGPLGLLQPIADAIKLITKEDIVPEAADGFVHLLAPVLILTSAFLVMAVIPFGVGLAPVNLPSGLLYLIAVSSISALGVFLAGWSSRNKYALLGAMRAVAQLVSYEVPQVLATVPVILWAGSLSMVSIVDKQFDLGWFVWSPPGILSFLILTIASIAEVNRTPFDLPEAESEIIAGYHTEYSGMRFGLFFLAEYLSVFAVSCLGTVLYLGGGLLPWPLSWIAWSMGTSEWPTFIVNIGMIGVFSAKLVGYVFLMFWIRATLPRMRVDRLMSFAWKYLVPMAVGNILIAAVWFEIALRGVRYDDVDLIDPGFSFFGAVLKGWRRGLFGWGATGVLVLALVWIVLSVNRGSRSSKLAEVPVPRVAQEALAGRGSLASSGFAVDSREESPSLMQFVFIVLSIVGLSMALWAVLARNLVRAALALVGYFFVVACQFILLEAEFMAAMQVVVYIGAVAILLLFGIMLTRNIQGDDTTTSSASTKIFTGLLSLAVFGILLHGFEEQKVRNPRENTIEYEYAKAVGKPLEGEYRKAWSELDNRLPVAVRKETEETKDGKPASPPTAAEGRKTAIDNMGKMVGVELTTRFVVAFEIAGLLLTVALVGAVVLARHAGAGGNART